jgi:protein-S-isoprenylcysteine O-methyltransferase Ste14
MPLLEEMEQQGAFLFRYRSFLPTLMLLPGWVVFILAVQDGYIPEIFNYFCFGVSLLGLILRISTVGFTPKNTSGRNTKEQIAEELNITGMYSTVRHPLYMGNFLMWVGIAMLTHTLLFIIFFIAIYWIYYERIMITEEQFLRRKFNGTYELWASQTPLFIPSLRKYVPPKYPFSLKKIARREVNGLLNVFIVFSLFECIRYYTLNKTFGFGNTFWIYGTGTSSCLYLLLKLLLSYTNYIDDPERI